MINHQEELDRHFAWFEARLPPRPEKFVAWLRRPSSRYARIPLAVLLILGGIFSFLPVLGLWMLPLGLLLFAQECCRSRWRGCSDGSSASGLNASAQKPCNDRINPLRQLLFWLYRTAWCDSKSSFVGKSVASSRRAANFSLTNQRADSFSSPGVNLEAKV